MTEITKISSKGQVVIPSKIRDLLNLKEGSRLIVESMNNIILLKKMNVENLKEEFKSLTKEGGKFAVQKGIKNEEDVQRIIHKGRGIKSD